MPSNLSLYSVDAVLILGTDGTRFFAHYNTIVSSKSIAYIDLHRNSQQAVASGSSPPETYTSLSSQKTFEKGLINKTKTKDNGSNIVFFDEQIVAYSKESDVMIYVVGNLHQNEILLHSVLLAFRDSLVVLLQ